MIIELQVISEGKDTEESMEKCQQRLETGGREMDYQRYLARDRKKKCNQQISISFPLLRNVRKQWIEGKQ